MIKSRENLFGAYAFLIGIILSVVVGVFTGVFEGFRITSLLLGILAVLGVIVGFFVAEKDIRTFLIASVALVLVSYTGISGLIMGAAVSGLEIGQIVSSTLQTLLAMFVPATIVVALKSVFSIASS